MFHGGARLGGNVLVVLCSFFIPGLGQLLQGRPLKALVMFVLASVLWFILERATALRIFRRPA